MILFIGNELGIFWCVGVIGPDSYKLYRTKYNSSAIWGIYLHGYVGIIIDTSRLYCYADS